MHFAAASPPAAAHILNSKDSQDNFRAHILNSKYSQDNFRAHILNSKDSQDNFRAYILNPKIQRITFVFPFVSSKNCTHAHQSMQK